MIKRSRKNSSGAFNNEMKRLTQAGWVSGVVGIGLLLHSAVLPACEITTGLENQPGKAQGHLVIGLGETQQHMFEQSSFPQKINLEKLTNVWCRSTYFTDYISVDVPLPGGHALHFPVAMAAEVMTDEVKPFEKKRDLSVQRVQWAKIITYPMLPDFDEAMASWRDSMQRKTLQKAGFVKQETSRLTPVSEIKPLLVAEYAYRKGYKPSNAYFEAWRNGDIGVEVAIVYKEGQYKETGVNGAYYNFFVDVFLISKSSMGWREITEAEKVEIYRKWRQSSGRYIFKEVKVRPLGS